MKRLLAVALLGMVSISAFAGGNTKAQWLRLLPVDNKMYLPYGEAIDNITTDGVIAFTDGTNTLFSITDSGTLGKVTANGKFVHTPQTQTGITTSSAIVITSAFMVVSASGSLTSVAAPLISTATATNPDGTRVLLMGGSSNVLTVQDADTLPNSCLELGSSTRAIGAGDVLELIIYGGKWYEVSFVNN